MVTTTIQIPVDEATAKAFSSASDEDRRKMELLLRLRLRDLTTGPQRSLSELMDEMGREAQARGLTPEILESLLNEP